MEQQLQKWNIDTASPTVVEKLMWKEQTTGIEAMAETTACGRDVIQTMIDKRQKKKIKRLAAVAHAVLPGLCVCVCVFPLSSPLSSCANGIELFPAPFPSHQHKYSNKEKP